MKNKFPTLFLAFSAAAILLACGNNPVSSAASSAPVSTSEAGSSVANPSASNPDASSSAKSDTKSYSISVSFDDDNPASGYSRPLLQVQSVTYIETKVELKDNEYTLTKIIHSAEQDAADAINADLYFTKYKMYFEYTYTGVLTKDGDSYKLGLPTSGTKLAYYMQDVHKIYPGKFPFAPTCILPNNRDWSSVETKPVVLKDKEFEFSYFGNLFIETGSKYQAQILKLNGDGIASIEADPASSPVEVLPQDDGQGGGETEEVTMDDALISLHREGAQCYLFLREGGVFTFNYTGMNLIEEGTYTYSKEDGFTFNAVAGATITVTLNEGVYHIAYVAASGGGQLKDEWDLDKSEADEKLKLGLMLASGGYTLNLRPSGVYVFEFKQYGIKEDGTFAFDSNEKLVLTPSEACAKAIVAVTYSENDVSIEYTAHTNAMIKTTFTTTVADLATLKDEEEGSAIEDLVLSTTSYTFTIKADGTYVFTFAAYGITETGTYAFVDGVIVFTPDSGSSKATVVVDYGAEGVTITYTASASDRIVANFTTTPEALNVFNV
ncbi:MAG: hypothetical protein J6O18_06240 [Bacilli bacterium]|nr:hypothetical protein [Bacilli bacterium]